MKFIMNNAIVGATRHLQIIVLHMALQYTHGNTFLSHIILILALNLLIMDVKASKFTMELCTLKNPTHGCIHIRHLQGKFIMRVEIRHPNIYHIQHREVKGCCLQNMFKKSTIVHIMILVEIGWSDVSQHMIQVKLLYFLWYCTIMKAIVEYVHVLVLVQSKMHHIMDGGMIPELGWGMGVCKTLLHNSQNLY